MEKEMRQCVLESKGARLVTFVDNRKDLKEGVWITLSSSDEPTRRWKVVKMTEPTATKDIVGSHDSSIIHDKDLKRNTGRKKLFTS